MKRPHQIPQRYLTLLNCLEDIKEEKRAANNPELVGKLDSILELLIGVIYQELDKEGKKHVH